jgi:uncharacterized membrane protein YfcA
MNEYLIISLVSLAGACLTLFSGFGLGTILVPVFTLFFPVELAIVLTAIVHFLNNVFKLFLLGKKADWQIVIRFGIPSVVAALCGAFLLSKLSGIDAIYDYQVFGKVCFVTPVKLTIAVLLILFSLFEILPSFKNIQFAKTYLPLGGLLSGFFGGLSGNQGALRSAFLLRANLSKESFIATGVVIACLIDLSRLSVYYRNIAVHQEALDYGLILLATVSAFAGTFFGNRLLKKVTVESVHHIVTAVLLVFAVLLGAGII